LYFPTNIILVIKSRNMRWAHVISRICNTSRFYKSKLPSFESTAKIDWNLSLFLAIVRMSLLFSSTCSMVSCTKSQACPSKFLPT
jgi:hypothetical protein